MFKGKKICVFGGTGTIGSLIVEYLLTQDPATIRIVSNDEHSLVKCERKWIGNKNMRYLLGDIRDYDRCYLALRNIDYVFNCAAIKHVPKAEYNPIEALKTNVFGLENIIKASINQGVSKLLHISTDKAVEPSTVMGITKRLSEVLLQRRWYQNDQFINMVCVRLGNVYGSRGSIVPYIHDCIKKKKPILITDKEMQRFFMTPEEVVDFIMKTFRDGKDGEIWVPKLKEMKLMDIVKKEAGDKCSIEIIGIRKGEKLREKMISSEEIYIADHSHRDYWIIPAEWRG